MKQIISVFLLFTYSVGFSHSMIPHCTATETSCHKDVHHHEHHEHHEHNDAEVHDDSDHVMHNDHFDESFYDLMLCVLSELEHHAGDCGTEACLLANRTETSGKAVAKTKLAAVLVALLQVSFQEPSISTFNAEVASIYLAPNIHGSPHRGPPSISC